jgi:uncharacterized membrane protein
MKLKIEKPFWQVLSIGVLAGMRSASAPAIVSYILSHHRSKTLARSNLRFLQSDLIAQGLKYMAIAELIGDKLPTAPDRIKPVALIGRGISGALAGAGVFKASGKSAVNGALIGCTAAIISTFGSFYLRKEAVKSTKISDPIIGAIEDALVVSAGIGLARSA